MKQISSFVFIWLFFSCWFSARAQQLLPEVEFFAKDKPGFLVLNDGTRVEFIFDRFNGKKASTAWRDFPNHVYYYEKNCPNSF